MRFDKEVEFFDDSIFSIHDVQDSCIMEFCVTDEEGQAGFVGFMDVDAMLAVASTLLDAAQHLRLLRKEEETNQAVDSEWKNDTQRGWQIVTFKRADDAPHGRFIVEEEPDGQVFFRLQNLEWKQSRSFRVAENRANDVRIVFDTMATGKCDISNETPADGDSPSNVRVRVSKRESDFMIQVMELGKRTVAVPATQDELVSCIAAMNTVLNKHATA